MTLFDELCYLCGCVIVEFPYPYLHWVRVCVFCRICVYRLKLWWYAYPNQLFWRIDPLRFLAVRHFLLYSWQLQHESYIFSLPWLSLSRKAQFNRWTSFPVGDFRGTLIVAGWETALHFQVNWKWRAGVVEGIFPSLL